MLGQAQERGYKQIFYGDCFIVAIADYGQDKNITCKVDKRRARIVVN